MRGLLTWGFGGHGLLGYNVNSNNIQPTPRQAPDALSFTPLNDRFITNAACGSYVTAALTSSEEVFVWGRGRGSSVSGKFSSPFFLSSLALVFLFVLCFKPFFLFSNAF